MTNAGQIKLVGNTFIANTSNLPSTIPTNAATGSNTAANTQTGGYGNATPGGATLMRVLNTSTGYVNVGISNNGVNNSIILQPNTDYFLMKYPYDLVSCSNNSNLVYFTPCALVW